MSNPTSYFRDAIARTVQRGGVSAGAAEELYRTAMLADEAAAALLVLWSIEESVTQGQEKELRERLPAVRSFMARYAKEVNGA